MRDPEKDKAIVTRILKAKNPYEVLKIDSNATDDDIKAAYKKLALRINPEKNKDPEAGKAFNVLKNAKTELLNKDTRKIKQNKRLKTSGGYSTTATDQSNRAGTSHCNNIDEANRILKSKNFYEMFGIQNNATDADIINAFKKLASGIDPEKNNAPEAKEAFIVLRRAMLVLMNKNERQKYDESLKSLPRSATEQVNLLVTSHARQDEDILNRILKAKNHYELLEIQTDATDSDIKTAFKKLSRRVHPDKNNHPKAHEAFIALTNAAAVLLKADTRRKYDESMRSPTGLAPTQFNLSSDLVMGILIGAGIVIVSYGIWSFCNWLLGPEEEEEDSQNNKIKKIKKN